MAEKLLNMSFQAGNTIEILQRLSAPLRVNMILKETNKLQ